MSNAYPDPFVSVLLLCGNVTAPGPGQPCSYESVVDSFEVPWEACAMDDAPALPAPLTVVVTVRSDAASGSCRLEIDHMPPGRERETLRAEQIAIEPGGSYTLGVQMLDLPMRRGTHWFFARIDGRDMQRTALRVRFRDQYGSAS